MPRYRLDFLDRTGSIRRSFELQCEDDDDAMGRAQEHDGNGNMELWEEGRRVAYFFRTGWSDTEREGR
jgi:hypothetical protein